MAPEIETSLLRWIILLPLAGFLMNAACAWLDRPAASKVIGPGVLFASFVVAMTGVGTLWSLPVEHLGEGAAEMPAKANIVIEHLGKGVAEVPVAV